MLDRQGAIFTVSIMVACEAFELSLKNKLLLLGFGFLVLVMRKLLTRTSEYITSFEDKPVLVTGCDTGFGNMLVRYLDSKGVTVFAGCLHSQGEEVRKLRETCSARLKVMQMDVTSEKEVSECVEFVRKATKNKGLWGIVNNAGLNFQGDIELNTMAQFNQVMQINYMGMVRATKAFLPMIKAKKGRVVNVTSVKGRLYLPNTASYTAAKFATEAFSNILRLEMAKWGVTVVIIEPCNFGGATGCLEMNRVTKEFETMWENMSGELRSEYGREYIDGHVRCLREAADTACRDLMLVIDAMCHALYAIKPQTRYLIGGSNKSYDISKWITFVTPFLPTQLYDRILMWCCASANPLVPAKLKQSNY